MSRMGTCRYAWAVQEKWIIPVQRQPHESVEIRVVCPEDDYLCTWGHGMLPPPFARHASDIRMGDCDGCGYYEPASGWFEADKEAAKEAAPSVYGMAEKRSNGGQNT